MSDLSVAYTVVGEQPDLRIYVICDVIYEDVKECGAKHGPLGHARVNRNPFRLGAADHITHWRRLHKKSIQWSVLLFTPQ